VVAVSLKKKILSILKKEKENNINMSKVKNIKGPKTGAGGDRYATGHISNSCSYVLTYF
jgi:hypothetical protein